MTDGPERKHDLPADARRRAQRAVVENYHELRAAWRPAPLPWRPMTPRELAGRERWWGRLWDATD